jgi:hypothetical protein
MPHSTTIAETVTAGFGSEDANRSVADGIRNAEGGVRSAGSTDPGQNPGPYWSGGSPDQNADRDARDMRTEMTEPPLIPKIFPVYAFI